MTTLRKVPKPKKRKRGPRGPNSTLPRGSKPMKRGGNLKRGTRLPAFNRARKKKRAEAGVVYGPFYDWVKENGTCQLAADPRHECKGPLDAHHIEHAGNGGVDARNVFDVCRGGHRLSPLSVHQMGRDSFEAHWRVNMQARADQLYELYLASLQGDEWGAAPTQPPRCAA